MKSELQQRYAQLALKIGDLTVKSWSIQAQLDNAKAECAALDKIMEDKPDET